MKKPCLIILTLILILMRFAVSSTFAQNDRRNYTLSIDQRDVGRLHDTVIFKKTYSIIRIPIKITNNSKTPLKYITMTCSWNDIFHLSNKDFEILGWNCDSNYPTAKTILPHKTSIFSLSIIKEKSSIKDERLKIGMNLFINNKQNEELFLSPLHKLDNIIWSNEVRLP